MSCFLASVIHCPNSYPIHPKSIAAISLVHTLIRCSRVSPMSTRPDLFFASAHTITLRGLQLRRVRQVHDLNHARSHGPRSNWTRRSRISMRSHNMHAMSLQRHPVLLPRVTRPTPVTVRSLGGNCLFGSSSSDSFRYFNPRCMC